MNQRIPACNIDAITTIIAKPIIPNIGPATINPIIIVSKATNLAISTNLLFSCPSIFDIHSIVIASGTTAKLIMPTASAASINFGKNIGINFGNTVSGKKLFGTSLTGGAGQPNIGLGSTKIT